MADGIRRVLSAWHEFVAYLCRSARLSPQADVGGGQQYPIQAVTIVLGAALGSVIRHTADTRGGAVLRGMTRTAILTASKANAVTHDLPKFRRLGDCSRGGSAL